jgi:23S rRNA (cytidine1920-2'-O)/16S rRNA (cytidine1409-2'-O)-methyltransferase
MRLDQYLVQSNLTTTRGQAKALIEKGDVTVNGIAQVKTSFKVKDNDQIELSSTMYVSRGAFKLVKAIEHYQLNVEGLVAADIGASTGGFTEVLLENKIKKVYCVDVGHGQLSPRLIDNPKIINLEKTNARDPLPIEEKVDLFVCDVSFISLRLIFKNMSDILKQGGRGIILIKPQFEAGRERIQKNGLVAPLIRLEVLEEIKQWFYDNNYNVSNIIESPIKGNKSKNIEYLGLYTKD